MKYRNIIILFTSIVLGAGIGMLGCTRKKVDYLGPEYVSTPSGFTASFLSLSTNVDFTTTACTTTAQFSSRVTYTLTFKGLTSGAVKSFTGLDDHIGIGSEGYIWNGSHDGIYYFRKNETVQVTLSFLRSDYTLSNSLIISKERNYFTNPNYYLVSGASAFNSFELAPVYPNWVTFSSAKPDGSYGNLPASDYGITAVDRLNIFRISGTSAQSDGYFAGGLQYRFPNDPATASMLPATWTDPSQLYYNIFIYSTPSKSASSIVNLELHESDASNPLNSPTKKDCGGTTIGAFGHDPCSDDGWVYQIPLKDFTGWKLFSIKFSDFTRNTSPTGGGSGDNKKEPTRIARIQFGVISNPAFKYTEAMFDNPVISYGAPFDPSK